MARQYVKAFLVTVVLALVIAGSFYFWRSKTIPAEKVQSIKLLDKLEHDGMEDFSVVNSDGSKISLSQFKGKGIILNFWASWCSPCVEELPSLVKLVDEFKGQLQLVAVSADSSAAEMNDFLKAFPQMKSPNIHVILDANKEVMKQFEVERLPESFIVGPDFKLVKKVVGSINWYTPDSIEYLKRSFEPKSK